MGIKISQGGISERYKVPLFILGAVNKEALLSMQPFPPVISRKKRDRKIVVSQLSRLGGAGIPFIKRERGGMEEVWIFSANEFAPNCCRPRL